MKDELLKKLNYLSKYYFSTFTRELCTWTKMQIERTRNFDEEYLKSFNAYIAFVEALPAPDKKISRILNAMDKLEYSDKYLGQLLKVGKHLNTYLDTVRIDDPELGSHRMALLLTAERILNKYVVWPNKIIKRTHTEKGIVCAPLR